MANTQAQNSVFLNADGPMDNKKTKRSRGHGGESLFMDYLMKGGVRNGTRNPLYSGTSRMPLSPIGPRSFDKNESSDFFFLMKELSCSTKMEKLFRY